MDTHERRGLYVCLISPHGFIRGEEPELGRDADTGGQVKYVLELARALGAHPAVERVELITRQVIDKHLSVDYAKLEEPLGECAWIVRVPFGPRRYLRKEALWPYVDSCVDRLVQHFRRGGRKPDILHGHYADAGYIGAQLSRLFGIPFVFTGHSLGRVKRQRLLDKGEQRARIDERYDLATRIEAEEVALETADFVVTSTLQCAASSTIRTSRRSCASLAPTSERTSRGSSRPTETAKSCASAPTS